MRLTAFAYLGSYLLSLLGNSIAAVALPLIILKTTGSALGAGTVAAATAVPAIAAGLLMGALIDRFNRRNASVVTDLISAACVAALPFLDLFTSLNVGWFVLFGVLGSLGDVPGLTAREALLPAIVRDSGLTAERLVGLREALGAVALVIGPAIAGTLIGLLDGSAVLWITAGTSGAAALLTLVIPARVGVSREPVGEPGGRASGWKQLREGWSTLFRSPFLLLITALTFASAIVLASFQGLILPVFFTNSGQSSLLGFVLSALAAGLLIGSAIYAVFARRGRGRAGWLFTGLIGTSVGFAVIATLASVPVVLIGAFVVGVMTGLFSSLIGVLTLERIPERLRGRVTGTQHALLTGAPALGIMLAAVLTETVSVNVAAIAAASIWGAMTIVAMIARPLRNLTAVPDEGGTGRSADQRAEGSRPVRQGGTPMSG